MEKPTPGHEQGQEPKEDQGKSQFEGPQDSLRFVNYSNPDTQKSTTSKKNIRSHLARLAHRKVRRDRIIQFQQSKHTGTVYERYSEERLPMIGGYEISGRSTMETLNAQAPPTSRVVQPHLELMNLLDGGRRDPFQSTAIQLTSSEHYLIDHFVNYVIPQSAVFYPRSKTEPTYQEGMTLHWLPLAITDPGIMNGIFFAACRSLALLYNNDSYLRGAFKYNEVLIHSINEAISKDKMTVKDSTIVKVLLLASSEFQAGNVHGTGNHIKAVGEMVRMKGGLQNLELGGFLRQLVLWQDRTSASYVEVSPIFPHLLNFGDKASFEHLSPGFRDGFELYQLSVDMANLLNDVCAYAKHIEQLSLPWSEIDRQGLLSRASEFEVRLLVLGSDYRNPLSLRVYSQVEECVFLALRVFLALMPHEFSFPPMGCKLLASRINSALSRVMLLPSWHELADLLLWVVFMASIVLRAGIKKEQEMSSYFAGLRKQVDLPLQFDEAFGDDGTYWILKLTELCSIFGLSSKSKIKQHLGRFLWVETLCDGYSEDIWSGLEAIQAIPSSE